MITQYVHHGALVFVDENLKGKHRDHCLCYRCKQFKPETREGNCPIANKLFQICVDENIVTPVYECLKFTAREQANG
jgi:hypothetical protein